MPADLTAIPLSTLQALRDHLQQNEVNRITRGSLIHGGIQHHQEPLLRILEGYPGDFAAVLLDAVIAERKRAERREPELVWTGPEGHGATARDTAVVLRELFRSARKRVLLAGYSFHNAEELLRPLHQAMVDHGASAQFFIQIQQADKHVANPADAAQAAMQQFLDHHWPFGPPYPTLHCDRRAFVPGPPWSSLHAKCVAVDGQRCLISSANFTTRAQDRNIETGILLYNPSFTEHLERQWQSLTGSDLVRTLRSPDSGILGK